jgi:magnesium chelatase subunit I
MEFVLHGLAAFSMISKKILESRIEFKDLMGSMLGNATSFGEEELDSDDFN